MTRPVCVHGLPDIAGVPPEFNLCARTESRADLLTAIRAANIAVVVLDLEQPEALHDITAVRELSDQVGLVAVTYAQDAARTSAALESGCGEILVRPFAPADLAIAMQRAIAAATKQQPPTAPRSIALIGATGGTGTTTIACHLAIELASIASQRVALADFDLEFGGIARAFDIIPTFTLGDLAGREPVDESHLTKIAVEVPAGIDLFARPSTMAEASAIPGARARAFLELAARAYPFVVADLARRMDGMTRALAGDADRVLIVMQRTVSNVDNARRILYSLAARGVPGERIELVVNRHSDSAAACSLDVIERELGRPLLACIPNDYASVNDAMDDGRTLTRASPVRAAIGIMARKLAGQDQPFAPRPLSEKRGQPRRWFAGLSFGRHNT